MKIAKHDQFARQYLTDLSVAKEFLDLYLQPNIKDKCDFTKLTVVPTSYIESDLKKHTSDVVYRIGLKDREEHLYIYNLVEHQSCPRKDMPYRILRYQLAIIQQHKVEFPKSKKLPLVVPIVFYNGTESPYPATTQLADLFADKDLFSEIGLGDFKLADLTIIEDEEIVQHRKLGLLEITLKHIRDRDFNQAISYILKALQIAQSANINEFLVYVTFSYLLSGRDREELNPLIEQVKQKLPEYGDKIMTYAEELRLEGEQRGEQRGIQIGEQKAQLDIAKKLLQKGIDRETVFSTIELTQEQINQLK